MRAKTNEHKIKISCILKIKDTRRNQLNFSPFPSCLLHKCQELMDCLEVLRHTVASVAPKAQIFGGAYSQLRMQSRTTEWHSVLCHKCSDGKTLTLPLMSQNFLSFAVPQDRTIRPEATCLSQPQTPSRHSRKDNYKNNTPRVLGEQSEAESEGTTVAILYANLLLWPERPSARTSSELPVLTRGGQCS